MRNVTNSRENLKRILTCLVIALLSVTSIIVANPQQTQAADHIYKNKTFYIHSQYPILITSYYSEDKVAGSREPEWNGRGYGTINTYAEVIRENYYNPATGVSYSNGYRYKVTMTNVDVKRKTPYLEIRAYASLTGGYYPTSIRVSASDGNNGCNVKANEYKQLAETLDAQDRLFAYIGYSFTGTDFEVNFEKCKYNVSYNLAGGSGTSTTQEAEFNTHINLHSAPTRYGYTFAGWRCNRNNLLYGAGADYYPNDWVGSGSLMSYIVLFCFEYKLIGCYKEQTKKIFEGALK